MRNRLFEDYIEQAPRTVTVGSLETLVSLAPKVSISISSASPVRVRVGSTGTVFRLLNGEQSPVLDGTCGVFVTKSTATELVIATAVESIYSNIQPAVASNLSKLNYSNADLAHGGTPSLNTLSGAFKGNTNWCSVEMIPCGADSVQLELLCDVADVSTYNTITYYVQATDLSGGLAQANIQNPYLGGVLQTMQAVTWAGAANPTFIAGTAARPTRIRSDRIPINNTGTGAISYLIVKAYYPSGVASGGGYVNVNLYGGRVAKLATLGVQSFYGGLVSGTNSSGTNTTNYAPGTGILPVKFRLSTRKKIRRVVTCGDSTEHGYKVGGLISATERWAIAETLAGRPTAIINFAVPGQTTAEILARLEDLAASGEKWDHLMWQVCSPNDGYSAALSALQIMRTHRAIALCDQVGATITLKGPMPVSAVTPTANELLCVTNARQLCIDMAGSRPGLNVCMLDELHDSTLYGKWIAVYNEGGDYLHPSELACTAVILPRVSAALSAMLV